MVYCIINFYSRIYQSFPRGQAELKRRKQGTGMKRKAVKLHHEISGVPQLGQSSEEILKSIIDAFYTVDADWRLTYINYRAEELWHRRREELIGAVLWDMFPESEQTVGWQMHHQAMIKRVPVHWEMFPPNLQIWVDATAYPTSDGGIAVYFRDISERKRAEEEAAKANEKLMKQPQEVLNERRRLFDILETLPMMICLITPDYHTPFANRSFREKFGEANGRRCYEYCCGYTKPCVSCESLVPLRTGQPHHWEVTSPDGETIIDAHDFPFTDVDGSPLILEMDIDITEHRKIQIALEESEERFRIMADGIPQQIWVTDAAGRMEFVNRSYVEFFGVTLEEVQSRGWQSLVHPADKAAYVREHMSCLREHRTFYAEARVRRHDGVWRWVESNGLPRFSPVGEFLGIAGSSLDITERKLAEEALSLSEDRFRAFVTASSEVIYLMNPDWSEMWQLHGKGFLADMKKSSNTWLQEYIAPEDQPQVIAVINEVIRTKNIFELECRVRRADGSLAWTLLRAVPLLDENGEIIEWFGAASDITGRKRVEEDALASERELLKVTVNSLGEGVVVINQHEQIIFINKAAAGLIGYSQEKAIGEAANKILYILDDNTSEPIDKISTQVGFKHLILITRDLKEIPISLNSAPIKSSDGHNIGIVIVFSDITEKQKTEQEMLKAAKLESLGILAGGVAHDFNNILAGILANLQLANLKLQKHQDILKHMESTIEITRKASDLTKQLLTFAKGGDPVKKTIPIANLVKGTVQFALSGSKIKPEFHLPETLWMVDIDQGQISQVFNNLTINAEQAMPSGGILEIQGENVVIETTGKYIPGQYVKLSVKDHGIGIPAEIIDKIFDPFFTTKKTGNGLGLSTSYSIIKKHDGYLEVESTPGISTIFYILLPVSKNGETMSEVKNEIAASGEAKILLMDDEEAIRNVGGEMLASFGYLVSLAKDGQEAVELYKEAKETGEPYDVVIMDLTIPGGLGGIETMAILRQIDPEIKAVISSGYASDPVMSEYAKYGFSGVVTKPYKFDELLEALNKVIDRKQLPLNFTF